MPTAAAETALRADALPALGAAVVIAARGNVVTNHSGALVVTTSKLDDCLFERYVDALRAVPGRRWDAERKSNVVPTRSKRELCSALVGCLPSGSVIVGTRVCAVA